jgi:apolipoprotein D and lipocalin family protein
MRWFPFWLVAATLLAGCSSTPMNSPPPLRTVSQVDLPRFMGTWYVIAHIPYSLERGKVATYDRYELRPDGRITTIFGFRRGSFDAPERQWRGVSWVVDTETNAEWRVQFLWPFRLPYLIVDLDEVGYEWSAIAHPSRNYFWVLARERSLPDETYRAILERAAAQGFDKGRVVKVPQPAE